MTFDKDEEDILNFVTAVANLRAYIFGIEQKRPDLPEQKNLPTFVGRF